MRIDGRLHSVAHIPREVQEFVLTRLKVIARLASYRKHQPQDLYGSPRIQKTFVPHCQSRALSWAILSAKYGLFFPGETRLHYDLTLSRGRDMGDYFLNIQVERQRGKLGARESKEHVLKLAALIRKQEKARHIEEVLFDFYIAPRRPDAYIALLHYAVDGCEAMPPEKEHLEHHLECCAKGTRIRLVKCIRDLGEE